MQQQIYNYIKASLNYLQFTETEQGTHITLSPVPGFKFTSPKKDKELLILDYKDYLYSWIITKKSAGEFIPLIERIDLNEERVIKAFDQTTEENAGYLSSLTNPNIIEIEKINIKENKNA